MEDCVFCKIAKGTIPATKVYEDGEIMVFPDIHPRAPVHLLFVPKNHVSDLSDADPALIKTISDKILATVRKEGYREKGYRIIVNGGAAMAVPHLHFHLLAGIKSDREV